MPEPEKNKLKKVNVKLEAVLFDFMEPLVLALKRKKSHYIASAMPSDNGYVEEYFVVSVLPEVLKKYMREECDLRFLFMFARNRRYFIMKAEDLEKDKCVLIPFEGDPQEDWVPDGQFFASSHTDPYLSFNSSQAAIEVLQIDGNWEMEDFGSFSRKLRDLHAFIDSLKKISGGEISQGLKKKIEGAFTGKSFLGGYSYVNFFAALVAAQPRDERFDLKKIKYASPGEIELTGKAELFEDIESKIQNFVSNESDIQSGYNDLHKYMSASKLLDIQNSNPTTTKDIRDKIETLSKSLLSNMGIDAFEQIHKLTDNNIIKTAKVALAIHRRLKSASAYFAQGRVSY